ncbi:MAG TPA: ferrous iron transport protein A [Gammaproteobacteria bacterium]|nr:ferrous iron transport protein A [Gammaproteobacteria bacterium]
MRENRALSETAEHTRLTITAITADKPTQCRLMGMGIGLGKEVELLRNRRGDVVIRNGNSRITLGREIASRILGRAVRPGKE